MNYLPNESRYQTMRYNRSGEVAERDLDRAQLADLASADALAHLEPLRPGSCCWR